MIITTGEAVKAASILSTINEKLPFKLSWALSDISEALEKPTKRYQEVVYDLVKQFGEPIEQESGQYRIKDMVAFNAATKELEEVEIELDVKPISADAIEAAGLKLTPEQFKGLKKFLIL